MIPKLIHYCWFGRGPKPIDAQKFIEGWKRLHPGYQIIEWNEDNFDVLCCKYVQEAYEKRKFAFVSDYARGQALVEHGGVYLDTDVELVAPLDSLLSWEGFLGFEYGNSIATSTMGFRPRHPLMQQYLDQYNQRSFVLPDGSLDMTTNVSILTKLVIKEGLRIDGTKQIIRGDVVCLPMQVLSPLDYVNFYDYRDTSTIAVHHYQHTWGGPISRFRKKFMRLIGRIMGQKALKRFREIIVRATRILSKNNK